MVLRFYIYENNIQKSILEYTGLDICYLLNEIRKITGKINVIDLLIGEEYGLIECEDESELENTTHRIYPDNKISEIVYVYFY